MQFGAAQLSLNMTSEGSGVLGVEQGVVQSMEHRTAVAVLWVPVYFGRLFHNGCGQEGKFLRVSMNIKAEVALASMLGTTRFLLPCSLVRWNCTSASQPLQIKSAQ